MGADPVRATSRYDIPAGPASNDRSCHRTDKPKPVDLRVLQPALARRRLNYLVKLARQKPHLDPDVWLKALCDALVVLGRGQLRYPRVLDACQDAGIDIDQDAACDAVNEVLRIYGRKGPDYRMMRSDTMHGLLTITAADRRENERQRGQRRRRVAGATTRATYEAESLTQQAPWVAEGISRRTWERRRKAQGVASPSAISVFDVSGRTCDSVSVAASENPPSPAEAAAKPAGGQEMVRRRPRSLAGVMWRHDVEVCHWLVMTGRARFVRDDQGERLTLPSWLVDDLLRAQDAARAEAP